VIPLATPNITGKEAKYLNECVETNFVSTVGPFVTRFEEMVAYAADAKFGVATCSGTAGLHLALTTVGVKNNDLVVLPSFTFIASANAISHCGASPWLFDISDESWTIDVALLKNILRKEVYKSNKQLIHKKSGRRVAAILPVYTLGQPADMEGIKQVAYEYQLPLVVDAAAALGCRYKGGNIGDLGDLTVFSFNGNKTITAGGGGMLVGNDEGLLKLARHLSTTARVGDDYNHDQVGFNYRLTNLQAAVGCAQIERLDEFVKTKRDIDIRYREAFNNTDGVGFFPSPKWAESACWFTGLTIDSPVMNNIPNICMQLRNKGIEARTFWKPIHLQEPYKNVLMTEMLVSNNVWKKILTLPCSTHLTTDEQDKIIMTLKELITER